MAHYSELRSLLSDHLPSCVCLQETHLKDTITVPLRGYSVYRTDFNTEERARGGVAILVRDGTFSAPVSLDTELEAVAVRVALPLEVTLCSVYLPPDRRIDTRDLSHLMDQLPPPFILLGDFNAHSASWGSIRNDRRGRLLESLFSALDCTVHNDGSNTHFCARTRSFSAIDLTVSSATVAPSFEWEVHHDLCGSDHFPIFIKPLFQTTSEARWPRWVLRRADWTAFSEAASFPESAGQCTVDEEAQLFTSQVISAAQLSIPKSATNPRRTPVPWWNEDCAAAVCEKRRLFNIFRRHPTEDNLIRFQRAKANAKRVVMQSKRNSWRSYVSTITSATPPAKVWEKVRKISGNSSTPRISGIVANGEVLTSQSDIADELGGFFASTSSSDRYSEHFRMYKANVERLGLHFGVNDTEDFNLPLNGREFDSALSECKDTAPGPDAVHYQMIRHLDQRGKSRLLQLYNKVWTEGKCPDIWKEAHVVPISKAGKDKTLPTSYRPISLTSCVCKLLERIVNRRLVWFLESNGLLSNTQCGFRRNRSTADQLVRLEAAIQDAFLTKQHLVAVFFDIEKAYDTTWRFGILRTLHSWGLRGRMMRFIEDFMADRSFRVRIGNCVSRRFTLENGVPQGSILSVTLFLVAINGAAQCVRSPVQSSLYVDDLAIYMASPNLTTVERQLQLTINRLSTWASGNGFTFSAAKTVCVHFCRKRGVHPDPDLRLHNALLPFATSVKFLGVTFDAKLTWRSHVNAVKNKCRLSLNLLRVLTNTYWGADRTVMLRLYRSLIRSKLDYGSVVYASARPSCLRALDPIHHTGIRLATGAFRTSPVQSILCESGEPSLYHRRELLSVRYAAELRAKPEHPAFSSVFQSAHTGRYDLRPRTTQPLGIRLRNFLRDMDFVFPTVVEKSVLPIPPWTLTPPCINLSLCRFDKSTTLPTEYQHELQRLLISKYPTTLIFTDGSKREEHVGCSVVVGERRFLFRLHALSSVYTAELYAIYKALRLVLDERINPCVILTDSLSALQSIKSFEPSHPLVQEIVQALAALSSMNMRVEFWWIPGHAGIRGNEMADASAKIASFRPFIDMNTVFSDDVKGRCNHVFRQKWQAEWDRVEQNKLKCVKTEVSPWSSSSRSNRREETAITRLRIGHCWWTHGHLLRGEEAPVCEICSTALTVEHIILNCVQFEEERDRVGLASALFVALGDNPTLMDRLIMFLKASNLLSFI